MVTCDLIVVSVERLIFSGMVQKIQIVGIEGEMCIFPNHSPLLTFLKPGVLHILQMQGDIEYICVFGGVLEVQKKIITILADIALRADEVDEKSSNFVKNNIDRYLNNITFCNNKDHVRTSLELSKAIDKFKRLKLMKK